MGLIHIMERSGSGDVRRFEESLKMAKEGVMEAAEIFEEMKSQFSERGGYGERYSQRGGYNERYSQRGRYGERYSQGDDEEGRNWDEMNERRYRDSMGRFR